MNKTPLRIGVIGCGLMAVDNMKLWLGKIRSASYAFPVVADPVEAARNKMLALFRDAGVPEPVALADASPENCARMAKDYALDIAYIASPTAFHAQQAIAFMESGIDVLLEKPAAPTAAEIRALVKTEQATGRKLSIGFNGSFCHGMRLLSAMVAGDAKSFRQHIDMLRGENPAKAADIEKLRCGDFASPRRVAGIIWENWLNRYRNSWKFDEGFIKDCGIHMLNAFCDVTNLKAETVHACLTPDASDTGTVKGRMTGGAFYRLLFLGNMPENVCESRLRILFDSGASCEFDIWGKWFRIADAQGNNVVWERASVDDKTDPLAMFMAYRDGKIGNPNPVSRSLDLAELMDKITTSRKKVSRAA